MSRTKSHFSENFQLKTVNSYTITDNFGPNKIIVCVSTQPQYLDTIPISAAIQDFPFDSFSQIICLLCLFEVFYLFEYCIYIKNNNYYCFYFLSYYILSYYTFHNW